jgi:hypothetical protein
MTTLTMERPKVRQSRRPLPVGHDLTALQESLNLESLREKLGGRPSLAWSISGGVREKASHDEDTWDEPESELTRAMNAALRANPERFVMSEKLKRIQSHAIRKAEDG